MKITGESTTTIQIHGRLTVDGVTDLESECRSTEGKLSLDLTQLKSADRAGIRAINALLGNGARLEGAPPYIRLLLEREPIGDETQD